MTGGLGATLLAELFTTRNIIQIFAINRKAVNELSLLDRQRISLKNHGLDPKIVLSDKVTLLETNTSDPHFGLPSSTYAILQKMLS